MKPPKSSCCGAACTESDRNTRLLTASAGPEIARMVQRFAASEALRTDSERDDLRIEGSTRRLSAATPPESARHRSSVPSSLPSPPVCPRKRSRSLAFRSWWPPDGLHRGTSPPERVDGFNRGGLSLLHENPARRHEGRPLLSTASRLSLRFVPALLGAVHRLIGLGRSNADDPWGSWAAHG